MNRWWLALPIAALVVTLAWTSWPATRLPPGTHADRIVVHKANRTLDLYSGGEIVRTYHVSLGRSPVGPKTQAGDGRTPEGNYRLDYRKLDSSFHRALHISYPSAADISGASARGVAPGGNVMVHGMKNRLGWIGRAHRLIDWTDGCVAVTDSEIEEILGAVPDGTPITIVP